MDAIIDAVSMAVSCPQVPPVLKGAKDLIKKLSEAEDIITNQKILFPFRRQNTRNKIPYECIASIVLKYGDSDLYKDVYQFIKI